MTQPWTTTCFDGKLDALGEGVPPPRSYGPFPRKLRHDVVAENVLTIEQAVHSLTGLPATVFRLRDRGAIRVGAMADVAVFDLAAVRDRATYTQPHQLSAGKKQVFVNGRLSLVDGQLTDVRAGRVLRRNAP